LGGQQSGHIDAVGFDMYVKLLEDTIRELKGEDLDDDVRAAVSLGVSLKIEESYVPDMNQRLMVYRKVAASRTDDALTRALDEIEDRYGPLPPSVLHLAGYGRVRIAADRLGVETIDREGRFVVIRFRPNAPIDPVRLVNVVAGWPSFLTAKTSAMVCWLFVGSAIFSAAFALLGGQALVEKWVLSMDLTPVQFMVLAQFIIFILGWPLEWTEIIVIFMPIFIPLLPHFNIDPLFFGLLVALNLQTAFLSPPVAMAAFYLKGVAPPHVTLNQIFAGMIPFMGIQIIAMVLLYLFPGIGLWLPAFLYGN
jgi:hypothetical protein